MSTIGRLILDHVADIVALVGGVFIVVGLGMIYVPAACIAAGMLLIAGAIIGVQRR